MIIMYTLMLEIDFPNPNLTMFKVIITALKTNDWDKLYDIITTNTSITLYSQLITKYNKPRDEKFYDYIQKLDDYNIQLIIKKHESNLNQEEILKDYVNYYAKTLNINKFQNTVTELLKIDNNNNLLFDIELCSFRIKIILGNFKKAEESINNAQKYLVFVDWNRKNKFKVYLGLFNLIQGNFNEAANCFYDCLTSFEAIELLDFEDIIKYLVFSGLFSYNRNELKKKIINNHEVVKFKKFISLPEAFYNCDYQNLFNKLLEFYSIIQEDIFIGKYANVFINEMIVRGYKQFLLSYQSVHLTHMAEMFGIRTSFLEEDLRNYIISKKLNCEIDKIDKLITVKKNELKNKCDKEFDISNLILQKIRKQINK